MRTARLLLIPLVLPLVAASPPPPGATSCSGCHGWRAPFADLTGRKAADIAGALSDYRTGHRPATVMDRIAKGFSPEESAAIAAWWETQR